MLRGFKGDWWGMSVRSKSNGLRGCVWEVRIDETKSRFFTPLESIESFLSH